VRLDKPLCGLSGSRANRPKRRRRHPTPICCGSPTSAPVSFGQSTSPTTLTTSSQRFGRTLGSGYSGYPVLAIFGGDPYRIWTVDRNNEGEILVGYREVLAEVPFAE